MPRSLDMSAPPEVGLSSFQAGLVAPMAAGLYYAAPSMARGTTMILGNQVRAKRITIARTCVLTSMAIEVTTAGSSGAIIRLGIFGWNLGRPQALLLDAGTVVATATGVLTLAINMPVNIGDNLLLAAVTQGGASTSPTVRSYLNDPDPQLGSTAALMSTTTPRCYTGDSSVSGAFPAENTWSPNDTAAPVVSIMAAA